MSELREALREVSKWLNEEPNRPIDRAAVATLCAALSRARTGTAYELMVAAQVAIRTFEGAMERQWPIGSPVRFRISRNQKTPSTGVVSGYCRFGCLRVKHDQAKQRSRYAYRSVHINDLIDQ